MKAVMTFTFERPLGILLEQREPRYETPSAHLIIRAKLVSSPVYQIEGSPHEKSEIAQRCV